MSELFNLKNSFFETIDFSTFLQTLQQVSCPDDENSYAKSSLLIEYRNTNYLSFLNNILLLLVSLDVSQSLKNLGLILADQLIRLCDSEIEIPSNIFSQLFTLTLSQFEINDYQTISISSHFLASLANIELSDNIESKLIETLALNFNSNLQSHTTFGFCILLNDVYDSFSFQENELFIILSGISLHIKSPTNAIIVKKSCLNFLNIIILHENWIVVNSIIPILLSTLNDKELRSQGIEGFRRILQIVLNSEDPSDEYKEWKLQIITMITQKIIPFIIETNQNEINLSNSDQQLIINNCYFLKKACKLPQVIIPYYQALFLNLIQIIHSFNDTDIEENFMDTPFLMASEVLGKLMHIDSNTFPIPNKNETFLFLFKIFQESYFNKDFHSQLMNIVLLKLLCIKDGIFHNIPELESSTFFQYLFTHMNSQFPLLRRESFDTFMDFLNSNDNDSFPIPSNIIMNYLQICNEHFNDHINIIILILTSQYYIAGITKDNNLKMMMYTSILSFLFHPNNSISDSSFQLIKNMTEKFPCLEFVPPILEMYSHCIMNPSQYENILSLNAFITNFVLYLNDFLDFVEPTAELLIQSFSINHEICMSSSKTLSTFVLIMENDFLPYANALFSAIQNCFNFVQESTFLLQIIICFSNLYGEIEIPSLSDYLLRILNIFLKSSKNIQDEVTPHLILLIGQVFSSNQQIFLPYLDLIINFLSICSDYLEILTDHQIKYLISILDIVSHLDALSFDSTLIPLCQDLLFFLIENNINSHAEQMSDSLLKISQLFYQRNPTFFTNVIITCPRYSFLIENADKYFPILQMVKNQ